MSLCESIQCKIYAREEICVLVSQQANSGFGQISVLWQGVIQFQTMCDVNQDICVRISPRTRIP